LNPDSPKPESGKQHGRQVAPPEFEITWQKYPKRSGNNPKTDALKAWNARVMEGVSPIAMDAGVIRYAAWCERTGKVDTETVMQAARFFGPSKPYEQDFAPPKPNGGKQVDLEARNRAAADEWLRQEEEKRASERASDVH
jgi:hypothetical protein